MKSVKVPRRRRRPSTTTTVSYNIKLQGMIFDPPVLLLTGMAGNKGAGGLSCNTRFTSSSGLDVVVVVGEFLKW